MTYRSNAVFIFFALVLLLSIPFWILEVIYPIELLPGLPLSAFAIIVPTLAAAILVYKSDRFSGVVQLLHRSFDFNRIKNKLWLILFIVINPLIAILSYEIIRATGKSLPYPAPLTFAILPLILFFFIGALGEEIGWSGYASEIMLRQWGIWTSGILLGSAWAVWHFIPLLQAHRSAQWIAWWSLGTISLRIIMIWLYAHFGRSVFAAAVFHTMINVCWQLFPIKGSFYDPQIFGLVTLFIAIIIFAAEQLTSKGDFRTA